MGEPFLHPLLPEFILMARRKGFTPVITTNGTLLAQRGDLLDALPHKLQISLHSHEGNGKDNPEQYIDEVMAFAKEAAQRGCVVVGDVWQRAVEQILLHFAEYPWRTYRSSSHHHGIHAIKLKTFFQSFRGGNVAIADDRDINARISLYLCYQRPIGIAGIHLATCTTMDG